MAALRTRVTRRLAAGLAGTAGYEVRLARSSPLVRLRDTGIAPASVLDVGAALGDWTRECAEVFPGARFLLVEPLSEFAVSLADLAASLPRAEHVAAAAAAADGAIELHVHADLVGSSLYRETEGGGIDGVPRTVPALTLDTLARERETTGPYLVKVDVQGAEPAVLDGAAGVLADSAAVVLEVSFLEFFDGGCLAHEMIARMSAHGFVVYDVLDLLDRPLDGALAQANLVFVPEGSPARRHKGFATPEQRAAQNAYIKDAVRKRLQ